MFDSRQVASHWSGCWHVSNGRPTTTTSLCVCLCLFVCMEESNNKTNRKRWLRTRPTKHRKKSNQKTISIHFHASVRPGHLNIIPSAMHVIHLQTLTKMNQNNIKIIKKLYLKPWQNRPLKPQKL